MSENINLQWESEEGLEFVMEPEKMKKRKNQLKFESETDCWVRRNHGPWVRYLIRNHRIERGWGMPNKAQRDGLGAHVWAGNGHPWGRQVKGNMWQYANSMERDPGSRRGPGQRIWVKLSTQKWEQGMDGFTELKLGLISERQTVRVRVIS